MSVGKLYPIGVFFFVKSNIIMDSYNILLQTDDYIPKKKLGRKIMNKYATLYWLIAVLLYLGYSFITNDWIKPTQISIYRRNKVDSLYPVP